ncbi:ABC transporter permease [Clostridium thermosuccinogenes]|uniref:ABC transporter permease n=1 Tax=Clostridium thermosuccinogenes TaxID=84032 RepID=UPI000CCBEB59|nr:ABC transporter permease [Pseudoclostridium thermosuccinogenes]PNT92337.1 ABC transporter permease [Pseudoclostridium thermosuccinogenes]
MKVYASVFKMRLINGLQYRTAALAGVATQFFWGFMLIMIYEAFYQNASVKQPITLEQLIDYVWLQQAFLAFITFWFRDGEIFDLITSGNIAYELCRPSGIYGFWYSKLVAQRLSSALLRCFPILIITFLLPEPYGLSVPPGVDAFIMFIVTLLLGLLVLVATSMFIYISVFYTMSPTGSQLLFNIIGDFFSGVLIPIPLMPEWFQRIAYILPFRLASDLPFRVYSGNIPVEEAMKSILIQLIWLGILVVSGRGLLGKALKRVVVQGG